MSERRWMVGCRERAGDGNFDRIQKSRIRPDERDFGGRSGRYWIRTSDPYLVEVVL